MGAVPKMSSGVPLLVRLPASWGLSAQAADLTLTPAPAGVKDTAALPGPPTIFSTFL